MRKIFVLLLMISIFGSLSAENKAPQDASGNDLNPILRGVYTKIWAGTASYIGKAGDNASAVGPTFGLTAGYDLMITDTMDLGFGASFGTLLIDTDEWSKTNQDSPWKDDFAPLIVGLDVDFTYLVTERFQIGANVGFDYYLGADVMKKDAKTEDDTNSSLMGIGGGLIMEYFSYARHFSFGLTADFNYFIDFDGMSVTATPFIKYTF